MESPGVYDRKCPDLGDVFCDENFPVADLIVWIADCKGTLLMNAKLPSWLRHLDEEIDRTLLVRLRDGRTLVGVLRSYDQFGNLLFDAARQRHSAYCEERKRVCYADSNLGCMLIRGENLVLFGRMKDSCEPAMEKVSLPEVFKLKEVESEHGLQSKNFWQAEDMYGDELL